MIKYVFFKDTPKSEIRVVHSSKSKAISARKRAKKKGYGVSRIRRVLR